MSALTFTLKHMPAQPVDLSPLVPDLLRGMAADEIGAIPLVSGNRTLRTGELFDIEGDDATDIHIMGSCDRLEQIGCWMDSGRITVEGDAGPYLGRHLRGGEIYVTGHAGHWLAAEMNSGYIEVGGSAGDFLGAALPGERKGMHGGGVLVRGNAGHRVGDFMRRGVICILGNAGDYCASRMGGGNILVLGKTGANTGCGMKRGTLILTKTPHQLPATFNDSGVHELLFLRLLLRELGPMDPRLPPLADAFARVHRYVGDIGSGGKGEVLIRASGTAQS